MSLIRNAVARLAPSSSLHSAPRRVVLLDDDDHGEPLEVLAEPAAEKLLDEVRRLAKETGKRCAGEHLAPLGWKRFFWAGKRSE